MFNALFTLVLSLSLIASLPAEPALAASTTAEITAYSLSEQTGPATIGDSTIDIEVAYDTDVIALVANSTTSPGVTAFVFSLLSTYPNTVDINQAIKISVIVINTGDLPGTYHVELAINNIVKEIKKGTINGNAKTTVSFSIMKSTHGIYTVDIGDLNDSSIVREEVTEPEGEVALEVPAEVEPEASVEVAASTDREGGLHWWLIGGLIVLGITAVLFFVIRYVMKRRGVLDDYRPGF